MGIFDSPWVRRVTIAKGLGFAFGLAGFFVLALFWPGEPLAFRIGILFWYTTLGGIIGLAGVIDRHPLFPAWRLPWWVRGPLLGAWMNLLLVLLMYDQLSEMVQQFLAPDPPLSSPWWIVLEGALIGLWVDWAATRFGGEGPGLFAPRQTT